MGCLPSKVDASDSPAARQSTKRRQQPSGSLATSPPVESVFAPKISAGSPPILQAGRTTGSQDPSFPDDLPDDITQLVKKTKDKASKSGGFSDIYEGELVPGGQKVRSVHQKDFSSHAYRLQSSVYEL